MLALNKHLNKKSPDLSPVKALPVLVPPCAAGARPTINSFAFISPKPVKVPEVIFKDFKPYFCDSIKIK